MENYSIVLFVMVLMIGLCAMADKIRVSYPILLITAGIVVAFLPGMPDIELNPEIIFLLFLPPLLYDAAFNISFPEFRTHLNTISALAISLVFMTASGIAAIAHYLIPGMSWPLAFVLGAILSATDAVAAIGITKGLGLAHKTVTILEGESLVNDASAMVAYKYAVAAVGGIAFSIWKASFGFVVLLGGGFLVGVVLAKALSYVLQKVQHNYLVSISFMLVMPFVTYLVAEEFHVSGVIAVVVLGLGISRFSKMVFPENVRQQSKAIWDVVIFLLNGFIFVLIGLPFPALIKSIDKDLILPYIGYAFIITIVTLIIRIGRVFWQQANLKKTFQSKRGRITENALLDFKNSLIISWSGMRGIVSLALAIGLPMTLPDGGEFPQRNAIIFISVMVVLFTLLGQGLTLPFLVKRLSVQPVREDHSEENNKPPRPQRRWHR